MIFYIGDECPFNSLKQVTNRLFLDEGWQVKGNAYYKGYSTECVLADSIDDILDGYKPAGKWCVIKEETIYHPVLRGFPVFVKDDNLTNLALPGFETALYEVLPPPQIDELLSFNEVCKRVGEILVENTENFYRYNDVDSMTVLFSGGLDTLTCWTIQQHVSEKFELSIHLPKSQDKDARSYFGTRREEETDVLEHLGNTNWGYAILNYYKKLNWQNAGYYAEVYTYRDLAAIAGIGKYLGKENIEDMITENDYLYHFLLRPVAVKRYKEITSNLSFQTENDLRTYLWNTIWYDHQNWHVDNNMVFCPFADIRIPEIVLRLAVDDLAMACVSGKIQKNIIRRYKPEYLSLLSDYKNQKALFANFSKNFHKIGLGEETKLIYR